MASIEADHIDNEITRLHSMQATFPETPEIKCSIGGMSQSSIDLYKATVFSRLTKLDKDYYFWRLGFKEITMEVIYPFKNAVECNIANMNNCGTWVLYSHIPEDYVAAPKVQTPVSIYFPETDTYGIGLVNITQYFVVEL